MSRKPEEIESDEPKDGGTGYPEPSEVYVTQVYPFYQYLITVKLTPDGKFIGIEEVRINKDFRSYKQKVSQKIFHYVDEYESE